MVKIQKANEMAKEFATSPSEQKSRPETKAIKAMEVGDIIRIVDHDHKVYKTHGLCALALLIHTNAAAWGRKYNTRHHGADLLVKRSK